MHPEPKQFEAIEELCAGFLNYLFELLRNETLFDAKSFSKVVCSHRSKHVKGFLILAP